VFERPQREAGVEIDIFAKKRFHEEKVDERRHFKQHFQLCGKNSRLKNDVIDQEIGIAGLIRINQEEMTVCAN